MAQVLIVDDHADILRALSRRLHARGHSVVTYRWTGADEESQKQFKRPANLAYDVFICDYELGTMLTGLDILAEHAEVPLRILFTGNPELAEQDRAHRRDPRLESVKILPKETDVTEYLAITLGLR